MNKARLVQHGDKQVKNAERGGGNIGKIAGGDLGNGSNVRRGGEVRRAFFVFRSLLLRFGKGLRVLINHLWNSCS